MKKKETSKIKVCKEERERENQVKENLKSVRGSGGGRKFLL